MKDASIPKFLHRPACTHCKVHDIAPTDVGRIHVDFSLQIRRAEEEAAEATRNREAILAMVERKARLTEAGEDWGVLGDRMDVFEKTPPHCFYLPDGTEWRAVAGRIAPLRSALRREVGACRTPERTRGHHLDGTRQGCQFAFCQHYRDVGRGLRRLPAGDRGGHAHGPPVELSCLRHDEDDLPRITQLDDIC